MTDNNKKKKKKKSRYAFIGEVLGGDILEKEIFTKNILLIVWIVFLIFVYMSYGYSALSELKDIETLQKEEIKVKNESLNQSVELVTKSRRANINNMVEKRHLELEESQSPVYVISGK
ncbi:MAG: FtsL-like putative cell division protein [Candidatus Azobacteroides sp.]|nr:FtsL-like putative cell division protein [Candidatus Azobacteroides sp.]